MASRSLAEYFRRDSVFAGFAAHAERLLTLQRVYEKAVPFALARNSRVANFKLGKLVIHASSGAVATKIKQLSPRLINNFYNEAGAKISEIQVSVQPDTTRPPVEAPRIHYAVPPRTKTQLASLAMKLPEGSPLRKAIGHFNKTVKVKE